ncbi:MAG: site-2 protease family protein [Actinomycetota bacterium]
MVRRRFPVLRVAGIEVAVHLSWFPVLLLVAAGSYAGFAEVFPTRSPIVIGLLGVGMGLAFFGSLITHELAHAALANRLGVRVRSILLFMFGGVAEIDGDEARTPSAEVAIALVGPATSVVLGSGFGWSALVLDARGWSLPAALLGALAFVNLGVALFNLLPALPLDGGRILRAALWRSTGDHGRATRIAGWGGRLLALAVAGGGIWVARSGEPLGLWYVPMGGFLWWIARAASRRGRPTR